MDSSTNEISREEVIALIAKSSVYGNLGLFVGAGLPKAVLGGASRSKLTLSWGELIAACIKELGIDMKLDEKTAGLSYPDIATQMAVKILEADGGCYADAVKKIKDKIAELTCWYPSQKNRDKYGGHLTKIDPRWIITTNYDLVLECLLPGKGVSLGPNDQLIASKELTPIYHLHGIRTNPDSIVITQEDYISLFRPNQYRQQKLPLLIKESTTVLIGYSLGDVNVLTAVDWAKNVYACQKINYPHEIIQLLYKESNAAVKPYKNKDDILIVEYTDLNAILLEITAQIDTIRELQNKKIEDEKAFSGRIYNPTKEMIKSFVDNADERLSIINGALQSNKLISGLLILLSKAYEETWERAGHWGAFHAYNENLRLSLAVLEKIEFKDIPPALFELIAYNLNKVGCYIGCNMGKSRAAHATWTSRNIPPTTTAELRNVAKVHNFVHLQKLLSEEKDGTIESSK